MFNFYRTRTLAAQEKIQETKNKALVLENKRQERLAITQVKPAAEEIPQLNGGKQKLGFGA
jgi:hypothetical protein